MKTKEYFKQKLAEEFYLLRQELMLTQVEMAKRLGVARRTVLQIEQGKRSLSSEIASRVVYFLMGDRVEERMKWAPTIYLVFCKCSSLKRNCKTNAELVKKTGLSERTIRRYFASIGETTGLGPNVLLLYHATIDNEE